MPTKLSLTLDAAQYQQQLDAVVRQTRQAAAQMETLNTDRQVAVSADTAQAERALSDLSDKSAKTTSQAAEKAAKSTETAAEKASFSIKSIWKEITNLEGGAKNLVKSMLAGGGLIGIAMAGVQSVIKLCTMALDAMSAKGKEAAETHRQFADSTAEAAANAERLKQSSNEAVTQLSAMASAAKLSNAEQERAVSLIAQLTRQYGDLGLSVDKATGKIKGLGSAIVEKETRDTQRQIRAIEAQLKERRSARNQEDQNVSSSGFNLGKINKALNWLNPMGIISNLTGQTDKTNAAFGLDKVQIGGEQDAKDAAERRAQDDKAIQELELKRQEAKKKLAEIAKKQLELTRIQNAALEEEKKERDKQAKYRSADSELGRMRYAEDKIANRQALIDAEKKDNERLRARTAAAKADMDRYAPGSKEADPQKYADAQRVYLQNAAEQAKSDEKIAGWQNQIKQLEYERAEAKKKMVEQAQYEVEYNKLILAGEFDKAEALKLENELKAQGLKLTQAEKDAILEQRKAMKRQQSKQMVDEAKEQVELNRMLLNGDYEAYEAEKLRIEAKQKGLQLTKEESEEIRKQRELLKQQKLQASNRDKAQDLKWQMMEKIGQGKEASEQRALRDAERTKGGKLTDSEIDATKKLNELVWNMSNMRDQQFGDLSIKTNSLTARGGFQGAAVVPDSDKYNREISMTNKTMLGVLQRIERLCDKFGKF